MAHKWGAGRRGRERGKEGEGEGTRDFFRGPWAFGFASLLLTG